MDDTNTGKLEVAVEEKLKELIANQPNNVEEAIALLAQLRDIQNTTGSTKCIATAQSLSRELQDKLAKTSNFVGLATILKAEASWIPSNQYAAFAIATEKALKASTKNRTYLAFIASSKFGKVKPEESLRRLLALCSLKIGGQYLDKTWGYGVLKKIDDFYKRITIDFVSKSDHQMNFESAAEALEELKNDHILSVRFSDESKFKDLCGSTPADVVIMALRDFGNMSIAKLEETMQNYGIISKADWKDFWNRARVALKTNDKVFLPSKRAEKIELHETTISYGDEWFKTIFKKERDISKIFEQLLTLEKTIEFEKLSDPTKEVVADRLNFAIEGAFLCPPPTFTRLILMAQRLNVKIPSQELVEKILDDDRFMEAGEKLSAKEAEEMVRFIVKERPDAVGPKLCTHIPVMGFNLAYKTLDVIREFPEFLPRLKDIVSTILRNPKPPATVLVWALRNWDDINEDWPLPSLYELMEHAIAICESENNVGEKLRMAHLLHNFYEDIEWFRNSFQTLSKLQREAIFYRLRDNNAMCEPKLKRLLTGAMFEIEPSLKNLRNITKKTAVTPQQIMHITSWHSLSARQAAYRQLVEVDIPKNIADISYARGLGDLSENFEYQSAKDHQKVLNARRDEWATQLDSIQGSYFAESETDFSIVGPGVTVTFKTTDGTEKTYTILGEWDSDENLNIIASSSGLAVALRGKKVGEKATIPSANGKTEATILAIDHLSDAIRTWIGTDASKQG